MSSEIDDCTLRGMEIINNIILFPVWFPVYLGKKLTHKLRRNYETK